MPVCQGQEGVGLFEIVQEQACQRQVDHVQEDQPWAAHELDLVLLPDWEEVAQLSAAVCLVYVHTRRLL